MARTPGGSTPKRRKRPRPVGLELPDADQPLEVRQSPQASQPPDSAKPAAKRSRRVRAPASTAAAVDDLATDVTPQTSAPPPQKGGLRAMLPLLAAGWIVMAGIALVAGFGPRGGDAPAASEAAVATGSALGAVSIQETFDALPMDSTLPEPWQVSGAGTDQIVALPTSVDRSIRLASNANGEPMAACRPTETTGTELRVALDYRLGRAPVADVTLLELRAGASAVLRLVLGAHDGRITAEAEAAAGATGAPVASSAAATYDPTAWRRIELTITASGEAQWQAHEAGGADAGAGSITLDAEDVTGTADTLCLWSPAGSPAGWVAVDDLLIEG